MSRPSGPADDAVPGGTIGNHARKVELLGHFVTAALAAALLLAQPAIAAVLPTDRLDTLDLTHRPDVTVAMMPDVGMAAGILVGPDGRELWARAPDERRAIASVTKIMTALVVLENSQLDDEVTVSRDAVRIGQSAAEIRAGEVYTVRELLPALLVKSGNDAAYALAEHVAGSEEAFVEMMNERAASLGLDDTQFANPHGLDAEGHYSTAADLEVLSRVAMAHPVFRQVVAMPEATLTAGGRTRVLEASNLLIGAYEGATGVKTGWTSRAGYCVIASAERGGIELTAVVLGTATEGARFADAEILLDWGFENYVVRTLLAAGERLDEVYVSDYLDVAVPALASRDVTATVFALAEPVTSEVRIRPSVSAPVTSGDRLGTVVFRQGNTLIATVPLVAGADVEVPGFFRRLVIAFERFRLSFQD